MKIIANIFRVLVGLLFIFSGLIKANDPTGFSYKLDEYFSVFAADLESEQDSIQIQITTPDETIRKSVVINPSNPTIQIQAGNKAWKAVPLENGLEDTIYFTDAEVKIGEEILYTTSLNEQDSNQVALSIALSASVNGNEIGNDKFDFKTFETNEKIANLNADKYVKTNPAAIGWLQGLRPYALGLAIFVCILEIILGLALLIGWARNLTLWLLFLMVIFFGFLTWYSAEYNKVTDCGCFGDAIKLTPWESFYKDVILFVSLLIIFIGRKNVKPIFSNPFAVRFLTVFTLIATGFSLYCWHYLPVKNFLKFKEGNNIQKLAVVPEGAPSDKYENLFIYAKNGVNEEFTLEQITGRDLKAEGYVFVDRIDKLVSKGFEPEIHDFKIMDESRSNDYVDDFFVDTSWKLLVVINDLDNVNTKSIDELKELTRFWAKQKFALYPLTASNAEEVEAFRHEYQLDFPFYYGDKTNLKSIIRSNPGLVLFKGNVVHKTWPSTRLPSVEKLEKLIQ
ncbi:MAG: hypothetical protein RLZZ337_1125 [Bacteroidota bacterium]|jgi:uncharacterized membrane protein YphA (DoxX/SURF4 family)